MSWFEHDSVRIYYEDNGSGTPVLLLPGWSMAIEGFAGLREAVLAAGYRVIAADLPGSGRSLPQPRQYPANYHEDDARSFAALLEHLSAAPAHLIGFGDGGENALLMAALAPGVARSVLTWGAAGQLKDPDEQLCQVLYNLVDHPIPPMQGFREFLVGAYGEANARAMSQFRVSAASQIIDSRGGDLSLSRAGDISCPVLLITGEHDVFAPPALVEQLAARIRVAEVHTIAGAGHDVHNSNMEWLARTVVEWLGDV